MLDIADFEELKAEMRQLYGGGAEEVGDAYLYDWLIDWFDLLINWLLYNW